MADRLPALGLERGLIMSLSKDRIPACELSVRAEVMLDGCPALHEVVEGYIERAVSSRYLEDE